MAKWELIIVKEKNQKGCPGRQVVIVYYGVVGNWVCGIETSKGKKPEGESMSTSSKCLLWCCG